mgnify:CR=1 FL=1
METIDKKQASSFKALKDALGIENLLASPRLVKVVVSTSFGKASNRKERGKFVAERLAKITGQKPSLRPAKHSVASFKLREGETIGLSVTLRGQRMKSFLDKLFNVAIPRTRDFRGFDKKGIDSMGNYTMGLKEHTIFPETSDEDIRDVFGMSITMVTTAKDTKSAEAFLVHLGVPFKKA